MTGKAKALLREALALPPEDRADVAAELLASLDSSDLEDPAAVQAAWAREIEERADRVPSGESAGEPWGELRERIARRLKER